MAKVGIVMGSDSDMPIMAKAADVLKELGIDFDMTIISAHREPEEFFAYAKGAEEKGHKVEIVRIMEENIGFCRACDGCMRNGGICVLKDDMAGPDEDFY